MISGSQKSFWRVLGGLVLIELLSWWAYSTAGMMNLVFIALSLVILGLAVWRPSWVALAGLTELVVGSKGYLFFTTFHGQGISIRMVLFVGLIIGVLRSWKSLRWDFPPQLTRPLIALLVWVGLMAGWGIVHHNGFNAVYTDANAFLYAGVFFGWWWLIRPRTEWRTEVMTILLAGATLVGVKSWLMMMLFGQNFHFLPELYKWVRNTGVGEITLIIGNIYRIFFQSQVYGLLIFLVSFADYLWRLVPRWWAWPLIGSSLGLYISLSRSFWLGLIAGLLVLAVLLVQQHGWLSLKRLWLLIPLGLAIWLFNSWAVNWPYVYPPAGHGQKTNTVLARLTGTGSAQAATARKNQIQPLLQAIKKNPIIGSGFGTAVTYYSTDPRVKGWRTTTAFELGYLDLWLKIGLVGLVLYAWWIWQILKKLRSGQWFVLLAPATIALVVTHLTSPYLNHPLGLGWLALVALYAADS